jgi:C4-dicarboxylate-specific signal transduction histidine kinase
MPTKPAGGSTATSTEDAEDLLRELDDLRATVRDLRERIGQLEHAEDANVEVEERLRRTQEEARETRERMAHVARLSTLGEMATGIAHEINQPLAAVATYAQACGRMIRARTADDVELLETLDRISHEALRAGAIINKLKDLVRRRDSRHVPCDLNTLVRDVAGLAAVDANHNGLDLRLTLAPDLPEVVADPVQIQQVILNLIRNGIESMEGCASDCILLVRTADADEGVQFSVVDNGVGLDQEQEEDLFTPFYTTKESGMGMGLSISRTIIRAHGGRVWFTPNPDRGLTFHFVLPVRAEAPRELREASGE